MMTNIEIQHTDCCGLGEICGIQGFIDDFGEGEVRNTLLPSEILKDFFRYKNYSYPYVIFTACDGEGYKKQAGLTLARFIRKEKLGTVRSTRWKHNPNSGNKIQVFLWEPDYGNLARFTKGK